MGGAHAWVGEASMKPAPQVPSYYTLIRSFLQVRLTNHKGKLARTSKKVARPSGQKVKPYCFWLVPEMSTGPSLHAHAGAGGVSDNDSHKRTVVF